MTNKRDKIRDLREFCDWVRKVPIFIEGRILSHRHDTDEHFGNYLASYYFGNGYVVFKNETLNRLGANVRRVYTKR